MDYNCYTPRARERNVLLGLSSLKYGRQTFVLIVIHKILYNELASRSFNFFKLE